MSHSSDTTVRVFFALWPTAAERNRLGAWQKPLLKLAGGRAMCGETLHATLIFIGSIEQDRLEALQLAAQEVDTAGFELCFDEACYWGHNHIVCAVPNHAPQQLMQLVGVLEQRLVVHRFKFDRREYKPHITLLRNARWSDVSLPAMRPACWQIKDFALVQSVQQQGVRGYRVLVRFPLEPGTAGIRHNPV